MLGRLEPMERGWLRLPRMAGAIAYRTGKNRGNESSQPDKFSSAVHFVLFLNRASWNFRSRSYLLPRSGSFSCFVPYKPICSQRQLRSEEHTSELQSHVNLVCRLLLEKKKN